MIALDDFKRELAVALIATIAAKALDELVDALKEKASKKTPERPDEHSKRS